MVQFLRRTAIDVQPVAEDLKFNDGVDFLPVVPSELEDVVEMRDRFDYRFQLAADPGGDVAEQYSGTEQTSHGLTDIPVLSSPTPTDSSATSR